MDSGLDASHRPGMTEEDFRACAPRNGGGGVRLALARKDDEGDGAFRSLALSRTENDDRNCFVIPGRRYA